ncbi:hypothetical protein PH242_03410 [Photorhabdus bodei]|uniref:hypothetical protein n=1 Tax=Photorhabdus bodei TaxID=2029681 RepID=UPI00232EF814|nr:hypothetical protein [Photorhabdus bodei]MDB6366756.1 hypothetical protein [Photorhabdus bodei]
MKLINKVLLFVFAMTLSGVTNAIDMDFYDFKDSVSLEGLFKDPGKKFSITCQRDQAYFYYIEIGKENNGTIGKKGLFTIRISPNESIHMTGDIIKIDGASIAIKVKDKSLINKFLAYAENNGSGINVKKFNDRCSSILKKAKLKKNENNCEISDGSIIFGWSRKDLGEEVRKQWDIIRKETNKANPSCNSNRGDLKLYGKRIIIGINGVENILIESFSECWHPKYNGIACIDRVTNDYLYWLSVIGGKNVTEEIITYSIGDYGWPDFRVWANTIKFRALGYR